MANEGVASGGPGSVGAGAAPGTAPSRMSDMGGGSSGGAPARGRMSDLGIGGGPKLTDVSGGDDSGRGLPFGPGAAEPGEKMTPLGDNWGAEGPVDPEAPAEGEGEHEAQTPAEGEEQQAEQQTQQGLTPEQQLAKYKEWMDTDQIPEEFLDRPVWVPGLDGTKVPVRLRDIDKNVMLYNDYQRKTTELANDRRQHEHFVAGRERWKQDVTSGDGPRGLRAMRAIGADKTLDAIVISYVQEMAMMESMPPALRERFIAGRQAEDRAYFAEQRAQMLEQRELERQQQLNAEAAKQGEFAPDVQYVLQSITTQMAEIHKELQINEDTDPLYAQLLSQALAQATEGTRDPKTGRYIEPPAIQLGRAPSRELLHRIALGTKQRADSMRMTPPKSKMPPPATPQLRGSGPAAREGQRGNLSAPKQARFSDLANTMRPR